MARNEEKAQSMLNRWWSMKNEDKDKPKKRPYLASKCNSVVACEKWRMQILREIGKKVTDVQNAALGEHMLRELNDEINKLIREKSHWERRILELGGPNYLSSSRVLEEEGKAAPGGGGYRYFGAARELAGVKELFHQAPEGPKAKKTRAELYKQIKANYYGFRDEDDRELLILEEAAEKAAIAAAVEEWKRLHPDGADPNEVDDEQERLAEAELSAANVFQVPSSEAIEKALLERHKQELLAKYAKA